MAKYTERLDIKMTPEDMAILAAQSLKEGMPLTVYARELILSQINPMLKGEIYASRVVENNDPSSVGRRG